MYLKRITSNVGDDATEQFMEMVSVVLPKYKNKFELNKKRLDQIDRITDVQKKIEHLQESSNDLIKDAGKLAFEVETKNDLKLLERSNDLQKLSLTKKRAR